MPTDLWSSAQHPQGSLGQVLLPWFPAGPGVGAVYVELKRCAYHIRFLGVSWRFACPQAALVPGLSSAPAVLAALPSVISVLARCFYCPSFQ